jgi:hypothetical protein
VGEELDRYFSSIFIDPLELGADGELYGTRSQTVVAVWEDGRMEVRERFVEEGGNGSWPWSEVNLEAQLVVEHLELESGGEQQQREEQEQQQHEEEQEKEEEGRQEGLLQRQWQDQGEQRGGEGCWEQQEELQQEQQQ